MSGRLKLSEEMAPRSATERERAYRLRRFAHPWVVVAFAILLLAAAGGAFVLGRLVEAPTLQAIEDAGQPIDVYAPVERRPVDSRQSYAGVVGDATAAAIALTPVASPAVVTRQNLAPGDLLPAGALLGVVSGQPYYGLPGPLPLYRDLVLDDTGDDVAALQKSLSAAGYDLAATGRVNRWTLSAVADLFQHDGFEIKDTIPYRQLLVLPVVDAPVVASAAVGTVVGGESPLVRVQTSPRFASFRADAMVASTLAVGQGLTVRVGTASYPGVISSIGEFSSGNDGSTPGRPVAVRVDDQAFQATPAGTSLTVLGSGSAGESLAVPLTAIRQDDEGDYVLTRGPVKNAEQSPPIRSTVTVTRSGGGWAAIEGVGLQVGQEILVSQWPR